MGESPHANGVHNRIGWRQRLARYQGLPVTLDLRMYDEALGEINQLGAGVRQLSDEALVARAHEIRARAMAGTRLEDLRSAFFAGSSGESVGEILEALLFEKPAECAAGGFEGPAFFFRGAAIG